MVLFLTGIGPVGHIGEGASCERTNNSRKWEGKGDGPRCMWPWTNNRQRAKGIDVLVTTPMWYANSKNKSSPFFFFFFFCLQMHTYTHRGTRSQWWRGILLNTIHIGANDTLSFVRFVLTRSFISFNRSFVHSFVVVLSILLFFLLTMFMMLLLCQEGPSRLLVSSVQMFMSIAYSPPLICLTLRPWPIIHPSFAPSPSLSLSLSLFFFILLRAFAHCPFSSPLFTPSRNSPSHPTLLSTIDTSTRPFPSFFFYAQGSHLFPLKSVRFHTIGLLSSSLLFSSLFSSLSSFLHPPPSFLPSFAIVPIFSLAHQSLPPPPLQSTTAWLTCSSFSSLFSLSISLSLSPTYTVTPIQQVFFPPSS